MVQDWRGELNRLATEFWFNSGELTEVSRWAESAFEAGEVDKGIVALWDCVDVAYARQHLQALAWEINEFQPWSVAAEPFALTILEKQLNCYLAQEISPSTLCQLVMDLDSAFLDKQALPGTNGWMGGLWNCCDWWDDSWTFENTPSLKTEAVSVLRKLASIRQEGLIP